MKTYVYAVASPANVKIGKSRSPIRRAGWLQAETDEPLKLIAQAEETAEINEITLHRVARLHRLESEWFSISRKFAKSLFDAEPARIKLLSQLTDRQVIALDLRENAVATLFAANDDEWHDFLATIPELRGRPPVESPLKKRFFRCTDEEWALIQQAAEGDNRSQFIRDLVVRAAKRRVTRR